MYAKSLIIPVALFVTAINAAPSYLLPRVESLAQTEFGNCSNPTMEFNAGFIPVNTEDFNITAQAEISTTAKFICSTLQSLCKATSAGIKLCDQAEKDSAKLSGQDASNTFNSVIEGNGIPPAVTKRLAAEAKAKRSEEKRAKKTKKGKKGKKAAKKGAAAA